MVASTLLNLQLWDILSKDSKEVSNKNLSTMELTLKGIFSESSAKIYKKGGTLIWTDRVLN